MENVPVFTLNYCKLRSNPHNPYFMYAYVLPNRALIQFTRLFIYKQKIALLLTFEKGNARKEAYRLLNQSCQDQKVKSREHFVQYDLRSCSCQLEMQNPKKCLVITDNRQGAPQVSITSHRLASHILLPKLVKSFPYRKRGIPIEWRKEFELLECFNSCA